MAKGKPSKGAGSKAKPSKLRRRAPRSIFTDPPRKSVLLLSCMDLRLLDNIVDFMNRLNLQNRYDHLILAGAAMGAARLPHPRQANQAPWKDVFFDHLVAAIDGLERPIKDIFLLEHLDCGAYKKLHPEQDIRDQYNLWPSTAIIENIHRKEAHDFAAEVEDFCDARIKPDADDDPWRGIQVHCLLMDLLGQVKEL